MANDNPKTAEEYFDRGLKRQDNNDLDGAIADYTESVRLDPNFIGARGNRGNVWLEKGEYEKAFADYDEVIRRNPNEALAWSNRGSAWGRREEYDKAINDLNEAIRLDSKNSMVWSIRGVAWSDKGKLDKAINDLSEAIRLDPKNVYARFYRGNIWNYKGERNKAIHDYDEALLLDPNHRDAIHNRALAMAAQSYEAELKRLPAEQSTNTTHPSKKMRNIALSLLWVFFLIWLGLFGSILWLDICGGEEPCNAKINPYLFLPLLPAFTMTSLIVSALVWLHLQERNKGIIEEHIDDPEIRKSYLENLIKSDPKMFMKFPRG